MCAPRTQNSTKNPLADNPLKIQIKQTKFKQQKNYQHFRIGIRNLRKSLPRIRVYNLISIFQRLSAEVELNFYFLGGALCDPGTVGPGFCRSSAPLELR